MVQALLLQQLWGSGVLAYAEVTVYLPSDYPNKYLRADVAILNNFTDLGGLVEVKQDSYSDSVMGRVVNRSLHDDTHIAVTQALKYDLTGLPWRYCFGLEDIEQTVAWAKRVKRGVVEPGEVFP